MLMVHNKFQNKTISYFLIFNIKYRMAMLKSSTASLKLCMAMLKSGMVNVMDVF